MKKTAVKVLLAGALSILSACSSMESPADASLYLRDVIDADIADVSQMDTSIDERFFHDAFDARADLDSGSAQDSELDRADAVGSDDGPADQAISKAALPVCPPYSEPPSPVGDIGACMLPVSTWPRSGLR